MWREGAERPLVRLNGRILYNRNDAQQSFVLGFI
jgi:hypothetical protein